MKANEEQPEPKPYLTIQRISQEAIICEGEKSDQLLQSVVCPVCLMLLPMPHYSCDTCDNAFCGRCLEDWWTAHPKTCIFKCPNRTFASTKPTSNSSNAQTPTMHSWKSSKRSASIAVQSSPSFNWNRTIKFAQVSQLPAAWKAARRSCQERKWSCMRNNASFRRWSAPTASSPFAGRNCRLTKTCSAKLGRFSANISNAEH